MFVKNCPTIDKESKYKKCQSLEYLNLCTDICNFWQDRLQVCKMFKLCKNLT
jgi:hypothetical protein